MKIQSALKSFDDLVDASSLERPARDILKLRFGRSAADLFEPLDEVYGAHPAYPAITADLLTCFIEAQCERGDALRLLDLKRDLEPDWFLRPGMVGYVFYIDRFSGSLRGVLDKLDYLEDRGVSYVHFMPCLKPRPGDSDGG